MTIVDNRSQEDVTPCEGCDGSGVRDPAEPSCALSIPSGWHVVERCDACARFASDEDAARVRHGPRITTILCADSGAHVIVPDRPAPDRRAWLSLPSLINRVVAALDRARRS